MKIVSVLKSDQSTSTTGCVCLPIIHFSCIAWHIFFKWVFITCV